MVLAGLDDLPVQDVDVLASPRDALRLIAALDGRPVEDPGEGRFRSRVFGQILTTPVPIDIMGDMEVRSDDDWTLLRFHTRTPVAIGAGLIHIPSVREQIDTCRLFGRPKDLQRAERLAVLIR